MLEPCARWWVFAQSGHRIKSRIHSLFSSEDFWRKHPHFGFPPTLLTIDFISDLREREIGIYFTNQFRPIKFYCVLPACVSAWSGLLTGYIFTLAIFVALLDRPFTRRPRSAKCHFGHQLWMHCLKFVSAGNPHCARQLWGRIVTPPSLSLFSHDKKLLIHLCS